MLQTPCILCLVLTSFRRFSFIRVYAARHSIFSSYYARAICGYSDLWHSRLPCFPSVLPRLYTQIYLTQRIKRCMKLVITWKKNNNSKKRNGVYEKIFFFWQAKMSIVKSKFGVKSQQPVKCKPLVSTRYPEIQGVKYWKLVPCAA